MGNVINIIIAVLIIIINIDTMIINIILIVKCRREIVTKRVQGTKIERYFLYTVEKDLKENKTPNRTR